MNDLRKIVASSLAQLRAKRSRNRISRSRAALPDTGEVVAARLEGELQAYLHSPRIPRPVFPDPIQTVFFDNPPPPPPPFRGGVTLAALRKLYPIGVRDEAHLYIVSPFFYIDRICEYQKAWENDQLRIKSVLFYAAKLMVLLSTLLQKGLPCPIRIDGAKAKIKSKNGTEYDAMWCESLRDFYIALGSLNANAFFLGNPPVGKSNLLENLSAAFPDDG
jgi:hypothetical protein